MVREALRLQLAEWKSVAECRSVDAGNITMQARDHLEIRYQQYEQLQMHLQQELEAVSAWLESFAGSYKMTQSSAHVGRS